LETGVVVMTEYGFKSRLPFGKHKGETIEEILDNDPNYLDWAVGYIDGFTLAEDVLKELYKILDRIEEQEEKYNYINDEFWKE
jgi:hypothetical protein